MIRRNRHQKRPLFLKAAFFILGVVLLIGFAAAAESAVVKTLSGRINKIDFEKQYLVVGFQHPVTGEFKNLTFRIQDQTGLGGVASFEDFQPKDPITIDYEENEEGERVAHYIKKVQLTGPPAGLEDFRGL